MGTRATVDFLAVVHWGAADAAPKAHGYRAASPSQLDRPHGHRCAARFDLDLAMRRRLQSLDQQLAGSRALQAIEFVCVDNDHRIAAMQRHVLRPLAMCHAHEFAESRLGVLKAPATARRLRGRCCQGGRFSSHGDQNVTPSLWRHGRGVTSPASPKTCGSNLAARSAVWLASFDTQVSSAVLTSRIHKLPVEPPY